MELKHLWNYIALDIFMSWPEAFTLMIVALTLIGLYPERTWCRAAIMAIVTSIYTDALVPVLPLAWQMLNSFVSTAAALFLLFRPLGWKRNIGVFILFYFFASITDLVSTALLFNLFGSTDRQAILTGPLWMNVVCMYPLLIAEIGFVWLFRKRCVAWAKQALNQIAESKRNGTLSVVGLLIVQFILIGCSQLILIDNLHGEYPRVPDIMIYVALAITLTAITVMIRTFARTRESTARMTQDMYIEEISDMFTSIRGQRHDFINHVQVMSAMLQMGKNTELREYMADVVKETRDMNEIVHHASPALLAFIKAKTAVALSRNISFTYELSDRLGHLQSAVKMIDVVKMIGNLVNNAMDEVEKLPPGERKIHLTVRLEQGLLELSVANAGRTLTEQEWERIFLPGYTTKAGKHDGLGLAIVRERVRHYKGSIHLETSEEYAIVFRILLPHYESAAGLRNNSAG